MKRNGIFSVLAAVLLIVLASCSGLQNQKGQADSESKEKSQSVKMDKGMTEQSTAFPDATKQISQSHGEKVTWSVFKDADWSKNFKGLKMKIEQVAITKEISNIETGESTPAVRVKFKVRNTSSKYKFEVHPAHAVLHTSTGKDLKAAMFISDESKKKIDHGETEETKVGYYVIKEPKVDQIEWVSFDFVAKKTQPKENGEKGKSFNTGKIQLN